MKKNEETEHRLGCSIDLGTMNIVGARATKDGRVVTNRIRDAFLDLDLEAKRSLKLSKVNYVEKGGMLIVLGDDALTMANLFKREVRRPLSKGVISAGELDAQEVLSLMTREVLGAPKVENEHCYYSVPAAPVDVTDQDVVYHQEVFRKILTEHGYTAHPTNEAMAIIYSQCAKENFSGLSVSYGSGMTNVALAYQATKGMEFSVARGGDWIDSHAAKAVGKTASQMCAVKERGVNLKAPEDRQQEAIALYVKALIDYSLESIAAQFKKAGNDMDLPEAVPFIVSGGTSKAGGFMDIFREEFERIQKKGGFPIKISDIRQAIDPLTAVAEGLLVLALDEYES